MSELGDLFITTLALFVFGFILLGSIGGWFVIAALIAREGELEREALKHAREDIVRANPINPLDVRV